jgi:hypothetical protein
MFYSQSNSDLEKRVKAALCLWRQVVLLPWRLYLVGRKGLLCVSPYCRDETEDKESP